MLLLRALAELVAPTGCAACDASVAPNVLFCRSCARSVERTADPSGVLAFGGAVADAIRRFKFHGRSDLVARFAALLVPRVPDGIDLLVPVPLHPNRLAERGYNQAVLLARPVARARTIALAARALARTRDTPMQSSLDRSARQVNLAQAFAVRDAGAVRGRAVLLVDDVRTTGSTLRACAAALHEVGAARVIPLVLACRDGSAVCSNDGDGERRLAVGGP